MNDAKVRTPGAQKKKGNWNYEFFLVFPLIALLNYAASPLFSIMLSKTLPASLEFSEPTVIELAGASRALEGVSTVTVPLDDLSAWAIGQFVAAKIVWIIGLLVATWFAARAVTELVRGEQFSDRMSRSLAGLSWTFIAVGPLYSLAQVPADNLIIRDLGLREENIGNGVTLNITYLWIGAVFVIEILRRAVKRGRAVQDELDGLV